MIIEAITIAEAVNLALCKIEERNGEEMARAIQRTFDLTLKSLIAESVRHDLHPGKMVSSFIDLIKAIDEAGHQQAKADELLDRIERQSALGEID